MNFEDREIQREYQRGLQKFQQSLYGNVLELMRMMQTGQRIPRTRSTDQGQSDPLYQRRRTKADDARAQFLEYPDMSQFLHNGIDKDAPNQFAQFLVDRFLSGKLKLPESFSDSDQRPLADDEETKYLRFIWSTGLDLHPEHPYYNSHLSDFVRVIWCGDYQGFLKMIENKSNTEIKSMIEKRETLFNISAIFFLLHGANHLFDSLGKETRVCKTAKQSMNVKNEHMKILIKLLSLGANVNAHDVTGKTPLHYCCHMMTSPLLMKMAERLVRAGANVNAKNRFEATPLMEVTLAKNFEFVEFLIHNGADPNIKDYSGMSPKDFARKIESPGISNLFSDDFGAAGKKVVKDKCSQCNLGKDHLKKCTGCYHSWYCSSQCQRQDWEKHKSECNTIREQYKLCTFDTSNEDNQSKPLKNHFVVKIQIDHSDEDAEIPPMIIVNKDKSFSVKLEKENNATVFDELYQNIVSHGHNGRKGYFHVIRKKNTTGKFEINSVNIQPSW